MSRPRTCSPVVCGVDTSPDAALAARVAGRIASLLDRPLALVHAAIPPSVGERPFSTYTERLQEQTAFEQGGYLHTVLGSLELAEPAHVDRVVEWAGTPEAGLRAIARRLAAELIVVGSRGQHPIEDVIFPASTSTELARDAPVPVVLAPYRTGEEDVTFPGRALVCGVDGSDLSIAAARTTGRLAERLGVPLVLVSVGADDLDLDDEGVAAAVAGAAPGVQLDTERPRGPVAEQLVAASARHDAGLIAVGSRGRSPLKSALLGSVTTMLLRRSDRPVLVVSRSAADVGVANT
jgi:nucleotide-binding universal stress UspA family protein